MIHAILNKPLNFEKIARESAADQSPGHALLDLAKQAPTTIHIPDAGLVPSHSDRLRGKLFSRANLWALARHVVRNAAREDVIFCTGEDVGIPTATLVSQLPVERRPRVAMFVHNLCRPRARAAMCLFGCAPAITHWLTNAHPQADFIARTLNIPLNEIAMIPEQTDSNFFTPAAGPIQTDMQKAQSKVPLIVSVGLEQRDYRTLAAATGGLPVEVRISGFSTDARALKDAYPAQLPGNMSRAFYDWTALRDLYRAADLVVVPLFENPYCAGLTSLLEGMACEKPVIITRTEGVQNYLLHDHAEDNDVCVTVPPGNSVAMRGAIESLLGDPTRAGALAGRGHRYLRAHHTPQHWLRAMLQVLSPDMRPAAAARPQRANPNLLLRVKNQFRSTRATAAQV